MGKVFTVSSFDGMSRASKELQSDSEAYTEIYTELMQKASTMGAALEGADNLAFVEQITGFTEELKAMADKLSLASQTLDKQRANYVAQQDSNITEVKKLKN